MVVPSGGLNPMATSWVPPATVSKQQELQRLVERATRQFESSSSWEDFVAKSKDTRGDLHPDVAHLPHRAAHLLNRLRVRGATVATKSDPWSMTQKLAALHRGTHQSANQHVEFLCKEFVDMIHKGQWILLPARLLLNTRNLRLSPLGVVPQ
jgi:hypothetical protein